MAIVINRGNPAQGVDPPYTVPNRDATTAVAPLYCGEIIYDTASKTCFVGLSISPIRWATWAYGWGRGDVSVSS